MGGGASRSRTRVAVRRETGRCASETVPAFTRTRRSRTSAALTAGDRVLQDAGAGAYGGGARGWAAGPASLGDEVGAETAARGPEQVAADAGRDAAVAAL